MGHNMNVLIGGVLHYRTYMDNTIVFNGSFLVLFTHHLCKTVRSLKYLLSHLLSIIFFSHLHAFAYNGYATELEYLMIMVIKGLLC